jgi:hypothetical protein
MGYDPRILASGGLTASVQNVEFKARCAALPLLSLKLICTICGVFISEQMVSIVTAGYDVSCPEEACLQVHAVCHYSPTNCRARPQRTPKLGPCFCCDGATHPLLKAFP